MGPHEAHNGGVRRGRADGSVHVKALVKAKAEPGIWLSDEPVPTIGADDVLVRVNKTGICGTDTHIYRWDDWARKTIPVPMVVGHEFAGEIVEVGAAVRDLQVGMRVSGEGHVIGRRSRASRAGKFHLDPETRGIGRQHAGRLRRICPRARLQRRRPARRHRRRTRLDPRPARQRGAHRAVLRPRGRGRAHHRRGADRHHVRRHRPARRRAARRHHRCEPDPARPRGERRRLRAGGRVEGGPEGREGAAAHARGVRRRLRDERGRRPHSARSPTIS